MDYLIKRIDLISFDMIKLHLETDSEHGETKCDLIITREQYDKCTLNIGSYFSLQFLEERDCQ